ncbi:MAG: glycosyltransferase family protein [Flavobacteriales bacterium]
MKSRAPHIKVYLSDEGYGHIVRQRAVIEAIRRQCPDARFTLQTHRHLEVAQRMIPDVTPVNRFNNITWHKQTSGSPDLGNIRVQFNHYLEDSNAWVERELADFEADAVISDFVYEAFEVAHRKGVPAFGVAHFTWDWFFSKLYPPPLKTDVLEQFFDHAGKATRLFFPPFTPEEILMHYTNAEEVPLILRGSIDHKKVWPTQDFKVMIVDSGSGLLSRSVERALKNVEGLEGFRFYVNARHATSQSNVELIPQNELLVDYFAEMDLIIGRAGFNTISECIGLRRPLLLLGEAANPEMLENIMNLKKVQLGSFISMDTFESELDTFLPDFLAHEYPYIRERMAKHTLRTTGADTIASAILKHLT